MWQDLTRAVEQQHRQFDRDLAARLRDHAASGIRIYCGAGCHNCCNLTVNATFAEALVIAQGLRPDQRQRLHPHVQRLFGLVAQARDLKDYLRRHRQTMGSCPLLEADGCCGIYAVRPLPCRALLSTRDPAWCAVDFASLHPLEKQAFLSSLDPAVVSFPSHYLASGQIMGADLERAALRAMAACCGLALSGNLTVLLWLEVEHRLSRVIPRGALAVGELLHRTGADHPLLLELHPEMSALAP